jgi:hypothetical protein
MAAALPCLPWLCACSARNPSHGELAGHPCPCSDPLPLFVYAQPRTCSAHRARRSLLAPALGAPPARSVSSRGFVLAWPRPASIAAVEAPLPRPSARWISHAHLLSSLRAPWVACPGFCSAELSARRAPWHSPWPPRRGALRAQPCLLPVRAPSRSPLRACLRVARAMLAPLLVELARPRRALFPCARQCPLLATTHRTPAPNPFLASRDA